MRRAILVLIAFTIGASTEETKNQGDKAGQCFRFKITNRSNLTKIDLEHDEGSVIEAAADSCNGKRVLKISIFVPGSEEAARRSDYEVFPGFGYYKLHTIGTDWDSARSVCQVEGGDLMEINSQKEKNVAFAFYQRKPTFVGATWAEWIWIGVRKTGGEFKTVSGKPLSSSGILTWQPGDPSGQGDCVLFHKTAVLADRGCNKPAAFLCEQPL